VSRLSRSAALLSCAFAALAVLVAVGAFTRVDQWSIDHVMPGASFHHVQGGLLDGLVPLLHSRWGSPFAVAVNIVTLPASFLVALAIAFACSRAFGIVLVAAVAVEVLCKELLVRPALHHGSYHIASFDSSFPSGHALRTVIVAGAIASTRPHAGRVAAAWAIASIVLLLLAGWHTPTDLAGGVLLAGLALLGARRLRAG
jgi:membrane-associated phospholipid phosphatase